MKNVNFGETISIVNSKQLFEIQDQRIISFIARKVESSFKEKVIFGEKLVPRKFQETLYCRKSESYNKHYRTCIHYIKCKKPVSYSITNFLFPVVMNKSKRVKTELNAGKISRCWFSSSFKLEKKEKRLVCKLEEEKLILNSKEVSSNSEDCCQIEFNKDLNKDGSYRASLFISPLKEISKCNSLKDSCEKMFNHIKCRNSLYSRSEIERFPVPDNQISWDIDFPDYKYVNYTSESVFGKPWADPNFDKIGVPDSKIWNTIDEVSNVDRRSFMGIYSLDEHGLPRNPMGRTGIRGRGCLGRWGPNHAADPIVTRWSRDIDSKKKLDTISSKPHLQFLSIQRRDTKEWAIPGGMVDPGEMITETLKREFLEEALNSIEATENQKKENEKQIEEAFKNGIEIYRGYVDDPRNTDNAWIETVAFNFHDEEGTIFNMDFKAGDDAIGVKWIELNKELQLYASHKDFLYKVALLRNSHW